MNSRYKLLTHISGTTLATVLAVLIGFAIAGPAAVRASNPSSGSISPTGPVGPFTGAWDGTLTGSPAPTANGEIDCVTGLPSPGGNCDLFTLTVTGNPSDWAGKLIRVHFSWTSPSTDFDMVVRHETTGDNQLEGQGMCSPGSEDSCPGPYDTIAGSSANGVNTFEEAVLSPSDSGTGNYYVRALYFAPNPGDQYHATVTVFNVPASGGSAAVVVPPTFDNYQPLDPNYTRRDDSPEPSVGVNWNTGNVMTMSRLQCNRTTFSDATSPADPNTGVSWLAKTVTTDLTGLDPILFTDPITGRTICGELQGAGGATNGIISDDDLTTTSTTFQTGGPTQGVDHQSIGGGPPKPLTQNGQPFRQPTTAYPHLFYYASQQTAYAAVATSFDGGVTYQPAVPMYTLAECTNLHGHIRVDPTGTVYVPNRNCGGHPAVIVSEDNGLDWSIRPVPTGSSGKSDPSVGIGAGGKIYLGFTDGNQLPHVAVSDDHGLTWHDDINLSVATQTQFPAAAGSNPTRAAAFPQVIAGDNNRAAIFFLATNSTDQGGNGPTGDDNGGALPGFKGTWYPFIATTTDGGISWTVVRADNDPLNPGVPNPAQQGVVCLNGTVCPGPSTHTATIDTRNLADFNEISIDAAGRIVAVYADGCNFEHPCSAVNNNSLDREGNQGTARITIIRQRGGSRLFRAFDPPAGPPSNPFVQAAPANKGVQVQWGTPADNGAPIRHFRVYRGRTGKGEKLVTTVSPGTNSLVDKQGQPGDYYQVTAVNKYGESRKAVKAVVRNKKSNAR
jgi:hypothetical protein